MRISVDLSDSETNSLREHAGRLGVSPETLVRAAISDLVANRPEDFDSIVTRVLAKNRELYRRLA